jgi:hypothetical protein
VIAARAEIDARTGDGLVRSQPDAVAHLLPALITSTWPDVVTTFCGIQLRTDQAELVDVGDGTLCVECVVKAPDLYRNEHSDRSRTGICVGSPEPNIDESPVRDFRPKAVARIPQFEDFVCLAAAA